MTRLKVYCALTLTLMGLLGAAVIDSRVRGSEASAKALRPLARLLPSADAVLDNSARYVRRLSLATPASAFSDFPAQHDYMPAGMVWAPPAFMGFTQPPMTGPWPQRPERLP